MKAVAVIPARLNSTRLPRKVLSNIAGKPMLQHVYERTRLARRISKALVATDSQEVAEAVWQWGGTAIITDPNLSSGTARIASIIDGIESEIIVNVQGDQPLVEPELIDDLVGSFQKTEADIVTPVFRITEPSDLSDPGIAKVVRGIDGRALYFSRTPIPYVRDAPMDEWPKHAPFWGHYGIYGFRWQVLRDFNASLPSSSLENAEKLEQLRFLEAGYVIHTVETRFRQVAVDTPDDLAQVRQMVASGSKHGSGSCGG